MSYRPVWIVIFAILLMAGACSPAADQPPTGVETSLTTTPMKTNISSTPTTVQLPPSTRLGAILTGSGITHRSLLTYTDLMIGSITAPVEDGAFALPEAAAMPSVVFEGRLQLSGGTSGFELIPTLPACNSRILICSLCKTAVI
jgi:hypothetical protein